MENFMIGMWGGFDAQKYARDFMPGFYGVEACMFPDTDEVVRLSERAREDGFHWGAHYPLVRKNDAVRDPLFLSPDEREREYAFSAFEREAALTAEYGGRYLLAHYPKPVILKEDFDFTYWRFGGPKEWILEKDYPLDAFETLMHGMFERLDGIARQCGLEILLENDLLPERLIESGLTGCGLTGFGLPERLFGAYPGVKACLDTGRLHLQQLLGGLDAIGFARRLAPFTGLIHLWNTSPQKNREGGHIPVSPDQKPEDGFADIGAYLNVIFAQRRDIRVLFEHNSALLSDSGLRGCYAWTASVIENTER